MPRKVATAEEAVQASSAQPGKYLTFRLGGEVYGLAILKVQEIIGMMPVTRVPQMPESIRGVVNLRGRVIPVIDLRVRFGTPEAVDTDITCIVVAQVLFGSGTVTMGVIVDEVREVADVTPDQISAMPTMGAGIDTRFLTGVATTEEGVVLLLDIDRVLSADEVRSLDDIASAS